MTSYELAKNLKMQHFSIFRLIDIHKNEFEKFGELKIDKITPGTLGGRPLKIFLLNEFHEKLLIMFLRNSRKVSKMKADILKDLIRIEKLNNIIWEDFPPLENCKNPRANNICLHCNMCGRFSMDVNLITMT